VSNTEFITRSQDKPFEHEFRFSLWDGALIIVLLAAFTALVVFLAK
jgi:hypothetical protein